MRTYFTVSSESGDVESLIFHDQVAMVTNFEGHAVVTLVGSTSQIHFHSFTVERFISELIAPALQKQATQDATHE